MVPQVPGQLTIQTLIPWEPWHTALQAWAESGELERAATSALMLSGVDEILQQFSEEIAAGSFNAIPDVVLLSAESIAGNAGAYSIDTNKIYLNVDWLETASEEWAIRVLTEELGHHLDWLFNEEDTPGDEGERFRQILFDENVRHDNEKEDWIYIRLHKDKLVIAEAAELTGKQGNDTIIGTNSNDQLKGVGGDDSIQGGDGDDQIEGGDGNDTLYGGDGNDRIIGGKDVDIIYGG